MRRTSVAIPLLFILAPLAHAHGYGERYDLPAPLWIFLLGTGLAVVLAFVLPLSQRPSPQYRQFRLPQALFVAAEVVSVAMFLLVIVAGIVGSGDPLRNLAPHLAWLVWWLGVAYLCAFVGNFWPFINPWRILFDRTEQLVRLLDEDARLSARLRYPSRLGVWPAVVLFLVFGWYYLASPAIPAPTDVAALAIVYSLITWTGMALFGKVWLQHGEAFTIAFGLLGRFPPVGKRAPVAETEDGFYLRPYAAGLSDEQASPSLAAFIVAFLAVVTFSAFTDTPAWVALVVDYYQTIGQITGSTTLGLLAFVIVWSSLYLLTCAISAIASRGSLRIILGGSVFMLVPVLLAYHAGHYLPLLFRRGQLLIPLASDPFGYGWDLFGSADYVVDLSRFGAGYAWYLALGSMIVGHVVAARLARRAASRLAATKLSAVPFLLLLTASAVIGLWMLAQPLVEFAPPT